MSRFKDIVGQEQLKEHLQNAIRLNKVSHAYIINGERSSGKEFIAKTFAMALQCENLQTDGQDMEPCQECHSCKQALSGNHPDIIFITHEKPNTISVDDIRSQINGDVAIKPYSGPKKIYIMNEGEKMTVQAQNALLKTLEEPPEYAVILILTSNVSALLPTIQSRCVLLNMKPVKDEQLKQFLMETMEIPDYKADICVAFAQGNVGKAIHLAGSENFNELKSSVMQLMQRIHDIDLYELTEAIKQIKEYKLKIQDYFDFMIIWYRDVLLYKATADVNKLVFQDEIYHIKKAASQSSYEGIEHILKALDKAKLRLKANVNFELIIELLLLTIKEN